MKKLLLLLIPASLTLQACPIPDFQVRNGQSWQPKERVEMHRDGIEGCRRMYGASYCPVIIRKIGARDFQTICGVRR